MKLALIVFLAGAIDEAACVGFVHFEERKKVIPTALCSMVTAACAITGIVETVHNWTLGPAFVLGVGFGAAMGVVVKKWRGKHET